MGDVYGVILSGSPPAPVNGIVVHLWTSTQVTSLPAAGTAEPTGVGAPQSATTSSTEGGDGSFLFTGLAPGTYYLSWTASGVVVWAERQVSAIWTGQALWEVNAGGGLSLGTSGDLLAGKAGLGVDTTSNTAVQLYLQARSATNGALPATITAGADGTLTLGPAGSPGTQQTTIGGTLLVVPNRTDLAGATPRLNAGSLTSLRLNYDNGSDVTVWNGNGAGGAAVLSVLSTGNVGIGVTAPSARLGVSYTPPASFSNLASDYGFQLKDGGTAAFGIALQQNSPLKAFAVTGTGWALGLGTDGAARLHLPSASPNVGIGIATPQQPLHVYGAAKLGGAGTFDEGQLAFGDDNVTAMNVGLFRGGANVLTGGGWLNLSSQSGFLFAAGAAAFGATGERMRITAAGNVGIGGVDPAHALHVIGDIFATSKVTSGADVLANYPSTTNVWGLSARNPGALLLGDATNLYGLILGHDNAAYGTALIATSNNPNVLVGYHNANNTPAMDQIGYGLKLRADQASIYFAQGTPGTAPSGAGTAPDWSEPRLFLQPTVPGSGDARSMRLNLRAAQLKIGPQDSTVWQKFSGLFSAVVVLERGDDANDNTLLFRSYNQNQAYFAIEQPGTQNLHIKKVTGQQNTAVNPPTYTETFTSLAWWQYSTGFLSIGTDDGITPLGQLYVRSAAAGSKALVVDTVASPTVNPFEVRINGGSQLLYVASNGYVGIGGTASGSPATTLHLVTTNVGNPRGALIDQYSTGADSANITGRKARGTPAAPTAVASGDLLFSLTPAGYDGAAYQYSGYMEWVVSGTPAAGSIPADFVIGTGAANFGTERLRLANSGNHKLTGNLELTGNGTVDGKLTVSTTDAASAGQGMAIVETTNTAVAQSTALFLQNILQHPSGTIVSAYGLDMWNSYGGASAASPAVTNLHAIRGFNAITNTSPSGTIASAACLDAARPVWLGSGTPAVTIQTSYGLLVDDVAASPVAGVTITNSYGIWVSQQSGGHYAIRTDGTSPIWFGGPVEFHSQTTAGTAGGQIGYVVFQINGVNVKIPYYAM